MMPVSSSPLVLGLVVGMLAIAPCAWAGVQIWPAPPGEKLYDGYTVRVDGRPAPVYACRVSAAPFNQVWPGYQRPIDQTELAGFATWDMAGAVTVRIEAARPFSSVVVRPLALGIRPTVDGRSVTFRLAKPGQIAVEFDGPHHALHLFANAPEKAAPKAHADNVLYFGPGVHHPGKLHLRSGQTLYVAGGAVVYTAVDVRQAKGVRILGRGVIDTSEYERGQGGGCIRLTDSSDVQIDGVILRDPDVWCLAAFGCENLSISNVKLIGLWRYNADGIDICNSRNVSIRGCFVRSFDDGIVVKGLRWGPGDAHDRPDANIEARNLVVWCDWGKALEIGAETSAPEIRDIRFQDIDIIRTTHVAMDIQNGDRAVVSHVRYANIRVEIDDHTPTPKMQTAREERYADDPGNTTFPILIAIVIDRNAYSQDTQRGHIRDIEYRDISVIGRRTLASYIRGLDQDHRVEGVTIRNLRMGGRRISTPEAARIAIGPFAEDVSIAEGGR